MKLGYPSATGPTAYESVCCLDLGTSRIKAALIDDRGTIRTMASEAVLRQEASFDAMAYLDAAWSLIRRIVTEEGPGGHIRALAVTNQRATIVPVDENGHSVAPALSWQDMRCEPVISGFIERFGAARFSEITGLPPGPLWSLGKLFWLKENEPDSFRRADRFVLLHDLALRRLGADKYVTDPSNASLTGLLDRSTRMWNGALLREADIREEALPELAPAGTPAGRLSAEGSRATGLPQGTILVVGGGDQQCSGLGAGAFEPGSASLCLGSAAIVSCPVEDSMGPVPAGLFLTAHPSAGWAVAEGINNTFGTALAWMADLLGLDGVEPLADLASEAPRDAKSPFFLPFLAGVGSPDFVGARAALAGLGLEHGRAQVARAAFEGVTFEVRRVMDAVRAAAPVRELILSGGLAELPMVQRLLTGLIDLPLRRSAIAETTLIGAAALAWTGAGRYPSVLVAARSMALDRLSPLDYRAGFGENENAYRDYRNLVSAHLPAGGG